MHGTKKGVGLTWRLIGAIALALGIFALLGGFHPAGAVDSHIDGYSGRLDWGKAGGCTDAHIRVRGGNILFPDIVVGHATYHWCWRNGNVRDNGSYRYNRWGEANAGYAYEGIDDVVKGGCLGCSHLYRRVYFHFSRSIQGFGEHYYPWVAITMRGDGSCTIDRTGLDNPDTLECGGVAGGGGGGGSW